MMLVLLSIECHAQGGPNPGQCEQVRAAIAQHGLQNARKHAMENHGLTHAICATSSRLAALVIVIVIVAGGPNDKAAARPGDHGVCRQPIERHTSAQHD
jgi:hypothetical protein